MLEKPEKGTSIPEPKIQRRSPGFAGVAVAV